MEILEVINKYEEYSYMILYARPIVFYNYTTDVLEFFKRHRHNITYFIHDAHIVVIHYAIDRSNIDDWIYQSLLSSIDLSKNIVHSFAYKYNVSHKGIKEYSIIYDNQYIKINIYTEDFINGMRLNAVEITIDGCYEQVPNDFPIDNLSNLTIYTCIVDLIDRKIDNELIETFNTSMQF